MEIEIKNPNYNSGYVSIENLLIAARIYHSDYTFDNTGELLVERELNCYTAFFSQLVGISQRINEDKFMSLFKKCFENSLNIA
jgi:hypothetical protein